MTYGISFLAIIIVGVILHSAGIFSPNSFVEKSYSGLTGFTVVDWKVESTNNITAYKKVIIINDSNATNFQVSINLSYDPKMEPNFSDVKFTWYNSSSKKEIDIPYWLEEELDSYWAKFWLKVPKSGKVYPYYGTLPINGGKLWNNIQYLNIYGGVFDYNISKMNRLTDHIISVAGGYAHTCVLESNGNVHCYGNNGNGQANDYNGGDAIGVTAGYYHTCVLKSNGNVHCYGDNYYGESNDYTNGDAIGVAAGWYRTCILRSNGDVICYGISNIATQNYTGKDAIGVTTGYEHTCVLKSNGNVHCYGDNQYGESNDYTNGDAIGVAVGEWHTCILRSNGNVFCQGYNNVGQAENYTNGDAIEVAAGYYHTCVLESNGNVHCYGNNQYGASNDYTNGDAIGVAVGNDYTCILKSNGNVHCYGWNNYGQANDYNGGDALNPFRKYVSVNYSVENEEISTLGTNNTKELTVELAPKGYTISNIIINMTYNGATSECSSPSIMNPDEKYEVKCTLPNSASLKSGDSYKVNLTVSYMNSETGLSHVESGSFSGTIK